MICVYARNDSPRLNYTLEVVFGVCLGQAFRVFTDWEEFCQSAGAKINYDAQQRGDALQIIPNGLLFEQGVRTLDPDPGQWRELPAFFMNAGTEIPFDLFAAAFYLICRYEEYGDFVPDAHGRFPARASLAYRQGFLTRPLVNEWAIALAALLEERFHLSVTWTRRFEYLNTLDIDMAWCYRHKGAFRTLGGICRDFLKADFSKLRQRMMVLSGKSADPFDNFSYQEELFRKYGTETLYFVLLGNYGRYDKNTRWNHPAFRALIRELGSRHEIGIHPSYYSKDAESRLSREIERLRTLKGSAVTHSRQHYLRMDIHTTINTLERRGIAHEYSMGYADLPGFRAGISSSYPYYDLRNEAKGKILIHPFAVMDVTLKGGQKLSPEEALSTIRELMDRVKACQGRFVSIFHNESLSETGGWEGWRRVYEEMLEMGGRA